MSECRQAAASQRYWRRVSKVLDCLSIRRVTLMHPCYETHPSGSIMNILHALHVCDSKCVNRLNLCSKCSPCFSDSSSSTSALLFMHSSISLPACAFLLIACLASFRRDVSGERFDSDLVPGVQQDSNGKSFVVTDDGDRWVRRD